jgi:WD40 repeat protein
MTGRIHVFILILGVFGGAAGIAAPPSGPTFTRVYPLAPAEGVFAYARISPDGHLLAYASELPRAAGRDGIDRTVTVVDLRQQKVLFTEPGIDAYWSNDGQRMIFLSQIAGMSRVSMRHLDGSLIRDVAPVALGDYFSWGIRDRRNLVLTIDSNFYFLDGDRAVLPAGRVPPCPGIGVGARPLLSKDGRRITTFVRGTIVVRGLTDCDDVIDTGIQGAKADFSWDGRYIAFHAPKAAGRGYDIQVVDLQRRTVRTVTDFGGSSFFPSWTRDGRLSFRYDGDDYRGFMMADHVLSAPERPLGRTDQHVPDRVAWSDVFPETAKPDGLALVTIWSAWSAHSPNALVDLQRASAAFGGSVAVLTATDAASRTADIARLRQRYGITLRQIPLAVERLPLTEAHNQIPATLLFRDGVLVDRRLGAQSYEALRSWIDPTR